MRQLNISKITLLSLGFLGIFTLVVVSFFYRHHFPYLSNDHSTWGEFGDFFGGLSNGVLSFLSFLAILYTLYLQIEELALNRRELELNRVELQTANDHAKKQSEISELQLQNAIRQKNELFLMEYSKIFKLLHDKIDNRSSIIGLELLQNLADSFMEVKIKDSRIWNSKGDSVSTRAVFEFLDCLEYLIHWDFQQFRLESGNNLSEDSHTEFSSSYARLIESFCSREDISLLRDSNFLRKLSLNENRFPNIARFTKMEIS